MYISSANLVLLVSQAAQYFGPFNLLIYQQQYVLLKVLESYCLLYQLKGLVNSLSYFFIQVQIAKSFIQLLSQVWYQYPNYSNLNRSLSNFVFQAISTEVFYFTVLEIYLTIITLLAFFRRESVIKLFLKFSILILRLILYLTSHDSVAILIKLATCYK